MIVLDLSLSKIFNDDLLKAIGIPVQQIIETTVAPQSREYFEVENTTLYFNLKQYKDYGILTINRVDKVNNIVDLALKIRNELISKNNNPLIILQKVINSAGLFLRIGKQYNKFIFSETINLLPDSKTPIVEIFNPSNHRFIQMILLKPGLNKLTVDCYIAFCLDVDDYMCRLDLINTQVVVIAPFLKKFITHSDLITSSGTFCSVVNKILFKSGKRGKFFQVNYDNYFFEAGINANSIYLTRNGFVLNYEFYWPSDSEGIINFYLSWQIDKISITLLDLSEEEDKLDYIKNRTKSLKTASVFPPQGLIKWSREQNIIPKSTYSSTEEFYNQVILALQSIADKVQAIDMVNAFWDHQYEGAKIVSRRPKREPDVQDTIHGLLFDMALVKHMEIVAQYPIAGGRLDFLVLGQIDNIGTQCVCIEFKHAHSNDLIHGLVTQLPAYMKAKGTNYGIYCILLFKGLYFQKPEKYVDEVELLLELDKKKIEAGLLNVRNLVIDLSIKLSPSQI